MSTLRVYRCSVLANWQTVAAHLGLTETDEEDVEEGKKTQDKRYKTLRRWKNKNLFKATYRVLVDVFLKLGKANLAEKVYRLLVDEGMYKISADFYNFRKDHTPTHVQWQIQRGFHGFYGTPLLKGCLRKYYACMRNRTI